uniref:Uncharacterized protein n=1 Tax=Homalodisca liturata TaxID=320908 RepID=A0A1B6HB79_9HEMI
MCSQRKVCLILLVGIPGSGKSFFRAFLEDYMRANNKTELGLTRLCSVCYDNYSSVRNPSQLCNGNKWKNERLQIMKDVEKMCILLKENDYKNIKELFPNVIVNGSEENPDCNLIVIDDNMFYRSMRYEYFKLGKANNLSFCQIFFDISLEKALKYNEQRNIQAKIPETIIKTMFSKIEQPQPARNLWEINSVIVSSHADFKDKHVFNSVMTCIKSAVANPLKVIDMDSIKEEAKRITKSNALHQIDNVLKQLVGLCIKRKLQENPEKSHLISQHFSDKRLNILQLIKEKNLILPIDFNSPVDSDKINLIKPILLDLLEK